MKVHNQQKPKKKKIVISRRPLNVLRKVKTLNGPSGTREKQTNRLGKQRPHALLPNLLHLKYKNEIQI
jgi:hypothetical protein